MVKYRFVAWHSRKGDGYPNGINESIRPALRKIEPVLGSKNGRKTIVVFREFFSDALHVAENAGKVREFAGEHSCDVLLTPGAGRKWQELKKQFSTAGITPVCSEGDDKLGRPDSVAIWFGADGRMFVFPKQVNQFDSDGSLSHSKIHRLPDTDIGIVICMEMQKLSSDQDVSKFGIIINPCFTLGSDDYLLARTALYAKIGMHPEWNGRNMESIAYPIFADKQKMHRILMNTNLPESTRLRYIENDSDRARNYLTRGEKYTGTGFDYSHHAKGQSSMRELVGNRDILVLKVDVECSVGLEYLPDGITVHMPVRGDSFHVIDVDKT